MTKAIPFLLQGRNIILVIDGKSHTISKDTHICYPKIVEALKAQDWDSIRDMVEPKKAIINYGKGFVSIQGNTVYWKDNVFHNALATRLIEMYQDGFPIEPMIRFMERLMQNASKRSVDQLYGFLEKNKLPITEDGHFLAYKKVSTNYMDIHSGTISNHIGAVVEMERNQVDDNPNSLCSAGLHFCSESYLDHFGSSTDPVMILKISPADVVSIPTDYNGAKGRCCRYVVVGQVNGSPAEAFSKVVNNDYPSSSDWPFAQGNDDSEDFEDEEVEVEDFDQDVLNEDEQLYDLVRVRGGNVEYYDLSLEEAREIAERNVRQKKAKLKIVLANTDTEVK